MITFFAKAIDKVRPGGVIAFITSNGMGGGVHLTNRRIKQGNTLLNGANLLSNPSAF